MTDAHKYASIALVGSGISLATLASVIAVTTRVVMRMTRRNAVPGSEQAA